MASVLQKTTPLVAVAEHDIEKVVNDFRQKVKAGASWIPNLGEISAVVDAIRHLKAIDDRKMLLEYILVLLSHMPEGELLTSMQNVVIELLYLDLPHPPATYIGPQYSYRAADGSNNNISDPNLGKANTPYSRSVQEIVPLPVQSLPDPGLVFDVLLKRDGFVKHPAGLSSLFFSFAALVIHSVFRTSHENVNINETSSYVDLAPLYGNNQEAQNQIRVRDGRGLLYPDVFAENRLILLPPAVSVLLVLFNRNHNYIARKLLEINERGWYIDPDSIGPEDPEKNAKLMAQEEDIFQTARLINAGWFGSVVFSDYFSCILGLVRDGSTWVLNPFGEIRKQDHSLFERGRGNACSVEFNCLYRWHATTSIADEKWAEHIFAQVFPNKPWDQVTPDDFKRAAKELQAVDPDCSHWTFGELIKQADGTYKDEELANFLRNATEHPGGAFRARGTPEVMRLNEVMGIMQSRAWGCCSLNDFRKFLGLKTYNSFLEWNSDPEIASAAEKLYGDINNLELYVGLQAEQAKPVTDGAGLCPGYTISRAILADAIALTRGDRFFTADYTPFTMTTWGFNDCQRDRNGPGFGSMLGRLFLRTLGDQCSANSTYTWFPLMTPDSMKGYLTKLGVVNKYEFNRPTTQSSLVVVDDYKAIKEILNNDAFSVMGADRAAAFIKGDGFFIASTDSDKARKEQHELLRALAGSAELAQWTAKYFGRKAAELIRVQSYGNVGGKIQNIDIVRDVVRCAPIHWGASELAGIPLKSKSNPDGLYTEQQLCDMLTQIYAYLFLDIDPAEAMTLHDRVDKMIQELLGHIKTSLSRHGSVLAGIWYSIAHIFSNHQKSARDEFIERFCALGYSVEKMANMILAVMVGSTVELSQTLTHVINMYLGEKEVAMVQSYARGTDTRSEGVLKALAYEAIRLDPPFAGVYRRCRQTRSVGIMSVQANDHVFLNIAKAHMDDGVFNNSADADLSRSKDAYLIADGSTRCLGEDLTFKIIVEVLRVVFNLKNVRRAPGQSGHLKRFRTEANQAARWEYLTPEGISQWPTSLVIQYDL
ncbi:linoleate diol synthase [Neolentinus lepideus HHB14362 ss-1]|uniref:Linoleate diol synthase n=1 Tax=Neolentinus lepideus HHB14362 ss-1 TaxID=1314782 RepID=A0A165UB26_9AGAM|nr:linoleate diol synthase [Neolentinus lepideus HHB14362 ss-1]